MKKVLFYVSTMFGFLAGNLSNAVLGQVNESDLLNNYYIGIAVPNGSKNDQLDALVYGNSHGYNTTGVLFSSYEVDDDSEWNISNWSAYDHTSQSPSPNHEFDEVLRQHYLAPGPGVKRIRVVLPLGRFWKQLNGQSSNTSQFWSPTDSHMRVNGTTPTLRRLWQR